MKLIIVSLLLVFSLSQGCSHLKVSKENVADHLEDLSDALETTADILDIAAETFDGLADELNENN